MINPGTLVIDKAKITAVSGIAASDKVYDGTAAAVLDWSGAALAGLVAGDDVYVTSAKGEFEDKSAGDDKRVNVTAIALGGDDLRNYELTDDTSTAFASIKKRVVSLRGSRTYDGAAALDASIFTLENVVAGETLGLTGSGSMSDKHAGTDKAVTLGSLELVDGAGGGLAANYTLEGGDHRVDIAKAKAAVTGVAIAPKFFDGTDEAFIDSVGRLVGIVEGDDVRLDESGARARFDDSWPGSDKRVTVTGFVLTGTDAANYELSGVTTATIFPLQETAPYPETQQPVFEQPPSADIPGQDGAPRVGGQPGTSGVSGTADGARGGGAGGGFAVTGISGADARTGAVEPNPVMAPPTNVAMGSNVVEIVKTADGVSATLPAAPRREQDVTASEGFLPVFRRAGEEVVPAGAVNVIREESRIRVLPGAGGETPAPAVDEAAVRFTTTTVAGSDGQAFDLTVGVTPSGVLILRLPEAAAEVVDEEVLTLTALVVAELELDVDVMTLTMILVETE